MNIITSTINYIFYLVSKYTKIVEKKYNISLHYFSIFRLSYFQLEKKYTLNIHKNLKNFIILGNYYLIEPSNQNGLSIISGGIGKDITFDLDCIKKFDLYKIIMIDPTEIAKNTTKDILNEKNIFIQKPLFSKHQNIKIFYPHENVNDNSNLSIENLYSSNNYKMIETITLKKIMKDHYIDKIDILKLDIEGVADNVILDLIENNILPEQICFELEKPIDIFKQLRFFKRIKNFLKILSKYYKIYNYTSIKKGYRMELLAIKND